MGWEDLIGINYLRHGITAARLLYPNTRFYGLRNLESSRTPADFRHVVHKSREAAPAGRVAAAGEKRVNDAASSPVEANQKELVEDFARH
jgi:hypothetical protein